MSRDQHRKDQLRRHLGELPELYASAAHIPAEVSVAGACLCEDRNHSEEKP